MISYSFFKKSDFWLKCHMPKHLILEKLDERVSPPGFGLRVGEFRGIINDPYFEMKRRTFGMMSSRWRFSPLLKATFREVDEELYVHVTIESGAIFTSYSIVSILAVVLGWIFTLSSQPTAGFSLLFMFGFTAIMAIGFGVASKNYKWEVGYVINAIGEITRGTAVDDPTK